MCGETLSPIFPSTSPSYHQMPAPRKTRCHQTWPQSDNKVQWQQHQFLTILLLAIFAFPTSQSFDASAVDNVLAAVHACRASTNPALTVSVVKDGAVLLSRGYGITSLEDGVAAEAVSGSTLFNVASLSKAFAATLMLKVMEEDGRYNLSTKVKEIMGEGFEFGDEVRTNEATVEDLLSHKMAIPANNRIRFDNNLTRANLKDRLKYLKTPDQFRNVFIYSNLMYGLATRMTEIIGKARWEDLVRRHLYRPLGMNRSTFVRDAVASGTPSFVQPYSNYYGTLKPVAHLLPVYWSELAGSGSVVTSADDMAKWMNFHLSKGQGLGGKRVMSENTMEELYKVRMALDRQRMSLFRRPGMPVTFTYDVYGFGFFQGYYRGFPIIAHSGSSYGCGSLLTLVPSKKLGIFTAMSGGDFDFRTRGTLHAYLLDQALNVPSWLNVSTMCSFPAPWHNVSTKAWPLFDDQKNLAYNVSAYLGLYSHPAYGTVEVRPWQPSEDEPDDGQKPKFTLFYGYGTWDLIPLPSSDSSAEPFYGKGRNISAWVDYSPFVFHAPPAGSDVIMEMSAPGLEKRSPPVFKRGGLTSGGSALNVYFGLVWSVFLVLVEIEFQG